MRIQRPTISQPTITAPTITELASLEGDGANITGSFSGALDASTFTSPNLGIVSGAAQTVAHLPAGTVSGSAQTIANLPAGTISGSAQTVANLPAGTVSGSITSAAQGTITINGNDIDLGVQTDDNVTFTDVTVTGDLTVTGTTTQLQVTNLNVEDLNITVASGSADSAAADGAGLTVEGAGATFTYTHSGTKWNLNKDLDLGSNNLITAGNVDGRDVSADGTKLDGIESNATADQTLADLNLDTTDDVQFDSFGVGTAASGTTGEIRATGDITAYYSSDERLKENFKTLDGALDKVNQLNGYEFDWKDGIEDIVSKTGHDIGVKAQEVQALYPELVHERDNGYLAVDYVKLTAVLLQAVKELSAKVDELTK